MEIFKAAPLDLAGLQNFLGSPDVSARLERALRYRGEESFVPGGGGGVRTELAGRMEVLD